MRMEHRLKNHFCHLPLSLALTVVSFLTFNSCAIFKNASNQSYTISAKNRYGILYGKIKKVKIRTFEAIKKNDKIVKGTGVARMDYPPKIIWYDRHQNVIKIQELSVNGSVYSTITNSYDSLRHKIAHKVFDDMGQLQSKILYRYDANGYVVEEKMFVDEKLHTKRKNYYNKTSKIAKEIWYSYGDNGIDTTMYVYAYNNHGDRTQLTAKADGSISFQTIFKYTYDKQGHMVTKKEYTAAFGLKYLWKFDNRGNVVVEKNFNADGSLNYKAVYTYDKAGNKIEEKVFEAGHELINRRTYTYNGNVFISKTFWPSGELDYKYTHHYAFDNHGNWIKEIQLMGNDPYTITIRKIKYYDE